MIGEHPKWPKHVDIDLSPTTTIAQLKRRLASLGYILPDTRRSKLIYRGHIGKDDETLADCKVENDLPGKPSFFMSMTIPHLSSPAILQPLAPEQEVRVNLFRHALRLQYPDCEGRSGYRLGLRFQLDPVELSRYCEFGAAVQKEFYRFLARRPPHAGVPTCITLTANGYDIRSGRQLPSGSATFTILTDRLVDFVGREAVDSMPPYQKEPWAIYSLTFEEKPGPVRTLDAQACHTIVERYRAYKRRAEDMEEERISEYFEDLAYSFGDEVASYQCRWILGLLEQQGEILSAQLFYLDNPFIPEDGGRVRIVRDFFLREAAALARGEGLGQNTGSRLGSIDWSESDDEGSNN